MPSFIETCSLEVRPLSDLVGRFVSCMGLGNAFTQPLGYMVIEVQVDGAQGYDKDQIALVILDLSRLCGMSPSYFRNSDDKTCGKHNQREGD